MTDITIRSASDKDREQWDRYVEQHADASPYHLYAWKQAVEQAYGFSGNYFVAERDSRLAGVLPLIRMGVPLGSKQLVALPYCDMGGILSDDKHVSEALLHQAIAFAGEEKISSVEFRAHMDDKLLETVRQPFRKIEEKVSMLLDLPDSADALWAGFKSKLRSQVRKAEKNGLSFAFSRNVDDFYTVFSRNMRDLGSPVHSRKWIEAVLYFYGNKAQMGLVYADKLPVGAGIILTCGQRVSIPWASTLREYNRLNPNMLLYWNFLRYSADNGFGRFDFGRSTPGEGTFRFKSQWGAKPIPLAWTIFTMGQDKNGYPASEGKSKREFAAAAWSRLPLTAANFFGPKLRKFISL